MSWPRPCETYRTAPETGADPVKGVRGSTTTQVPADVDAFVRGREAMWSDLVPGAEARVTHRVIDVVLWFSCG